MNYYNAMFTYFDENTRVNAGIREQVYLCEGEDLIEATANLKKEIDSQTCWKDYKIQSVIFWKVKGGRPIVNPNLRDIEDLTELINMFEEINDTIENGTYHEDNDDLHYAYQLAERALYGDGTECLAYDQWKKEHLK